MGMQPWNQGPHGLVAEIRGRIRRSPSQQTPKMQRVTIDPTICHGKPTVRGLRYPVETILELLGGGMSYDEILADYPDLEREDILAVLAYAARLSRVQRIDLLAA